MKINNPPTYIRRRFRILEKIIRDIYPRIKPGYNSFEQYIDIVNYYAVLEFRLIEFDNIRTDRIQLRDDVMDVLYGLFKNEIQTYYNSNKTIREEVEETSEEIKEKKLAGLLKDAIPPILSHKGLVSVEVHTPSELYRDHPHIYDDSHDASFIVAIDINPLDVDNRHSDDIRREVVHMSRSLFNIVPLVFVRWQTTKKKDILEQYQDEKILSIPDFKLFNYDWKLLMSFLNKRGNPKWKIMGDLGLYGNQDVIDLNNLVSIEGDLFLYGTPITSLGVLESVGGSMDLYGTSMRTLGNLQSVGGYLDLRYSKIESLGNLKSVGGYLDLRYSKIESLGNLQSIGKYLDLRETPIKSLGNLQSVGDDLNLFNTPITDLENLESVGGSLDLYNTPITSLGTLQSVGGYLDLYGTSMRTLGNLQSVGGYLDLREAPISKKYTDEEIRQMVNVGGDIYL